MARFQILSLIGGGVRGAFITSYLSEVERKLGRPIGESFDLIAGTSTGGIIAAGLAAGMSAAQMNDFYIRYGAQIFSPRPPYRAKGIYRFLFPIVNWVVKRRTGCGLDSAFRAKYCPHALQKSFDEGFGDRRLGDVTFTRLIIPAVNLTKGEPHVFRSRHLPKGVHDKDIRISDALIATTAAPTYFPHRQIGEYAYVDGSVWAADPSILALAEALRIQQFENATGGRTDIHTSEIHLLSIGTGRAQFSLSPPGSDAGILYWASRVADLMGTSQVQGTHLPLKFILGDRYRHINFRLTEHWGLDEVEYLPQLFDLGKERARATFEMLDAEFCQHRRTPFAALDSAEEEIILDEFGFV